MKELKGKVAIVTGGNKGIGRAISLCFAEKGANIAIFARDKKAAEEVIKEINRKDSESIFLKTDITKIDEVKKSVTKVFERFGRIDMLINNASVFKQTNFEDITEFELDNIIKTNFKGVFLLTQEVFKHMKQQKSGKIINITSVAAKLGSARAVHYASTKAAQVSFTKSIAKLGGPYNINVNAVAPGFIETDMIKDMLIERREDIEASIPFAKVGTPDDVAGLVLFLASNNANYITGQTICVDGGFCMI